MKPINDTPRSAATFIPPDPTLTRLKEAAASCTGCDLYKHATQTVFGEGQRTAQAMFVGEQPGDYEDREGRPFVGPAGRVLDKALVEAGIDRQDVYVTNAVKHFKWEPLGKRRKHKKPLLSEIKACRPWLEAELEVLRPELVVCLGLTAAHAVLGRPIRLGDERGRFQHGPMGETFVTIHPSAILRFQEEEEQEREYGLFVADLKQVGSRLRASA